MGELITRTGEAFEGNERLTVIGGKLEVGQEAPPFLLTCHDVPTGVSWDVSLAEFPGKLVVVSFVNDLITPLSKIQTGLLDYFTTKLRRGGLIEVITISLEPTERIAYWKAGAAVEHHVLSAKDHPEVLVVYGVLVKEWNKPQRAIFVIRPDGTIGFARYVRNQGSRSEVSEAADKAYLAAKKATAAAA